MHPSQKDIRTSVIAENLFLQAMKNRVCEVSTKYILGKNIEAINLPRTNVLKELTFLEEKYAKKGKCRFIIDGSTKPKDFASILTARGYTKELDYDDIWWFLTTKKYEEPQLKHIVSLKEIRDLGELISLLKDTELEWWIKVFGGCLTNKVSGLTTKLYVGTRDGVVVSTATAAFYKNVAIFKGAEVAEDYQRRGIHTQMMYQRIIDAINMGCDWVVYQTSSTNIASIGTGKKFGFTEIFRREAYSAI